VRAAGKKRRDQLKASEEKENAEKRLKEEEKEHKAEEEEGASIGKLTQIIMSCPNSYEGMPLFKQ